MPASLSRIQSWSIEHLIDAAAYWSRTADRWEDAFLTMRNQAHAIIWNGAGGAALRQRTAADLSVVSGKADRLRRAAKMARDGASDISAARRRVLYGVEDAQNAGFTVEEDLSVTDPRSTTAPGHAVRQAQARAFAADIRSRAERLEAADAKVAGDLTSTAGDVGDVGFAGPSNHRPANHSGQLAAPTGDSRNGRGAAAVADGQPGGADLVGFKQYGGADPPAPSLGQPQIGPFPVPSQVAAAAPKTPSPAGPAGAAPEPPAPAGPRFGRCVGTDVKTNIGKEMVKEGFKSGAIKAGVGAAFGAGLSPELGGAGALPGAVLGFVGGFAEGLLEAPVTAAAEGALECSTDTPAGLKP